MSLYADEDLSLAQTDDIKPKTTPLDPLQALTAALTCPSESPAQAEALIAAGQRFEEQPEKLPELCGQLLPMVADGGESLLRAWTLEMVGLAVGRSGLKVDVKSQVAQSSLDALHRMLQSNSVSTLRAVIPIFSTIHPILFRLLATTKPPQSIIDLFQSSKTRLLALAIDPTSQPQSAGVKAAAWKFVQKVLLAGTRAAAVDPRLQSRGPSDPNISMISPGSPLSPADLEEEAKTLRTQLVMQMYSLSDPAVLHPLFQIIPILCKARPSLSALLVSSLASWSPAALTAANRPAMHIRSVEKTVRMVMAHLVKLPQISSYAAQINEAIVRQKQRMDAALDTERIEKYARLETRAAGANLGKHPVEAESSADAVKRARLEVELGAGEGKGAEVDISGLPVQGVIEAVMAGLMAASVEQLHRAFNNARRALLENSPDAIPVLASSLGVVKDEPKEEEDDEILNPLDMDLDDDDLLLAEPPDEVIEEPVTLANFSFPPPEPLPIEESSSMVAETLLRIWQSGSELAEIPDKPPGDGLRLAVQPKEMYMLLLARLATRGGEGSRHEEGVKQESAEKRNDTQRNAVVDFIRADFTSRSKFAAVWLNEEWYNDRLSSSTYYPTHLDAILRNHLPNLDARDKSLSTFLLSLPEIPRSTINSLDTLCQDPERGIVGFLALRDLIETRPPTRSSALDVVLQLCTHPERKTRVMAIRTVRSWVPDTAMSTGIVNFALGILRRLVPTPVDQQDEGMEVEDGEEADETVSSKFLPTLPTLTTSSNNTTEQEAEEGKEPSVSEEQIQQHVELLFALSRRQQDLLEDIFRIYPRLSTSIQKIVENLLTPLIQSLGPTPRLLEVLRNFPVGSDKLALKVIMTLSAGHGGGGKGGELVELVKGLVGERELDPRFIVPIVGDLDKTEIQRQLPRIVSLLGTSDTAARDMVRTAFASVLAKMTPADLLVALHMEEGGLKATIEAIGICFSMTTVFRSDVLASSLSRLADLPSLPTVFLRTVIQAVTTYKSLIPFIANNVLPKLVAKRIWEQPALWDGFIRLAKAIAPMSFGSLLQLPLEQIMDVVKRQPGLKGGLKGALVSRGTNKGVLDQIFGEEA